MEYEMSTTNKLARLALNVYFDHNDGSGPNDDNRFAIAAIKSGLMGEDAYYDDLDCVYVTVTPSSVSSFLSTCELQVEGVVRVTIDNSLEIERAEDHAESRGVTDYDGEYVEIDLYNTEIWSPGAQR